MMSVFRKNIKHAKTALCRNIVSRGKCSYGDNCRFAHSIIELVPRSCNYGTKCSDSKCVFAHSKEKRVNESHRKWWFKIGQMVSGPFECTQLYTCSKIIKKANIDIGLSPVGPFKPFSVVYPDHRLAFMIEPDPKVWNIRPAIRLPKFTEMINIDKDKLAEYKKTEDTDSDDLELYGLTITGKTKFVPEKVSDNVVSNHTKISSVSFTAGVDTRQTGEKTPPRRLSADESANLVNKIIKNEYNDKGWGW